MHSGLRWSILTLLNSVEMLHLSPVCNDWRNRKSSQNRTPELGDPMTPLYIQSDRCGRYGTTVTTQATQEMAIMLYTGKWECFKKWQYGRFFKNFCPRIIEPLRSTSKYSLHLSLARYLQFWTLKNHKIVHMKKLI